MPAAVLIIDVQTDRMILGNRQVNHILRYHFSSNANLDELKRFPGFHLDGAPVQPEEWPLWRAMQYGEELQGEELMIVRGDGTQAVLQISAAPVRDAQGTVIAGVMVFTDITERKRAERDVHYLIELGEMINRAASPADLLIEVCQHAVGYLDLSRCLFAEVQPGSGPAVVYREFQQGSSPELAPIAGLFPLEEFHPEIIATLKEGRPVVNRDAQADPRTAPGYDTSTRPAGLRSYIAIPILRGGDWSGVLLACDQRPRNWNDRQVALLQATAERAWTAYENRRLLVELAENEERFRLASRAMDGFVFDYNLITGEIHCSEGFEKITGFVQEALPGIDTWKTRIHAEDLARLEQAPGPQTLAGGGLFEREYRFQRAAGDWIDLREYGMIIRGANERPSRVLGIMADVTRRKSIERALRRSEETARLLADEARLALQKMETVINSMGEAVLLATPEGRLEHANPAAVALHGYHNETEMLRSLDAVYEPFEAFKPEGEPIPREQWPIYRALAGETVINMEMHVRRKDNGRRWIGLVSGIPTYSQRGDVLLVLCTITDITPIRLAEQQRHEMTTRLEVQRLLVAQREQERLQLARDLHDGPIQNLIGLTYTLQNARATSQNPAVHALLEDARKEAQKLVGELRGMCNNLRPPVLIRFGLSKAIQAYAEELRARGAPPLSLHLDDDTGALDDDTRMGLYRIFQECMANVLRHAHAGQVWVRLSIDARAATLEVQDDGAGFTLPDDLLNLARQGHLGLVGMKERAEAIGAVLEIQSAPGAGARLTVRVQRRA
jgi:PAS domain S-box-containing protein